VRDYYQVDGQPLGERNPKWLQDDYVKFIRFGQWRIQQSGAGVLAFITNHGYLDNPTFRGMRQQLMQTFTDIYVLDLHGNTKKKERCPDGSPDENVFDIQQGVAIGVFVKEPGKEGPAGLHHADLWGLRQSKYNTLFDTDLACTEWRELTPEPPFHLFVPQRAELRPEYERGWKVTEAMPVNSVGIVTSRDGFVFDLDEANLQARIAAFLNPAHSDETVGRRYLSDRDKLDVGQARKQIRGERDLSTSFARCLYRPFDMRHLLYHDAVIERPRREVMRHMRWGNLALCVGRAGQVVGTDLWDIVFCSSAVEDFNLFYRGGNVNFPLYIYSQEGLQGTLVTQQGHSVNLNPSFLAEIEKPLGLAFLSDGTGDLVTTFGPEDVFHYVYAILHSPTYRTRYADFLKIDFPRVPLTTDVSLFRTLCALGAELVALHLMESPLLDKLITSYPLPGDDIVEKVAYRAPGEPEPGSGKPLEKGRVYISEGKPKEGKAGQYFDGIPPEVWHFHVGGYQVCEKWLKDRKGRVLSYDDRVHYQKIVVALQETIRLMAAIDQAIPSWPLP